MDILLSAWWQKSLIQVCFNEYSYSSPESAVTQPVPPQEVLYAVSSATEVWDAYHLKASYSFVISRDCDSSDIVVSWARQSEFTVKDWVGMTRVSTNGNSVTRANVFLNVDDKEWCVSRPGHIREEGCYAVHDVIIHEFGHALGFSHSNDPESYMFNRATKHIDEANIRHHTSEDVRVFQKFYRENVLSQSK